MRREPVALEKSEARLSLSGTVQSLPLGGWAAPPWLCLAAALPTPDSRHQSEFRAVVASAACHTCKANLGEQSPVSKPAPCKFAVKSFTTQPDRTSCAPFKRGSLTAGLQS